MKISRILVPTDFSENSEVALRTAANFVNTFGSTVDLIHVVPVMRYFHESMEALGVPFSIENKLYPHTIEVAHAKMEALASKYIPKEHRGRLLTVIDRKPSEAIARQIEQDEYDLVIISGKGEHSSPHILGGTTEKVIRFSKAPVFRVNESFDFSGTSTIVVPLDFSETSYSSIIPAFEVARVLNADISLVHVIELYASDSYMIPYVPAGVDNQPVYESLIQNLDQYLKDHHKLLSIKRTGTVFEDILALNEGANQTSISVKTTILKGITVYQEIVDYMNEHGDLLVMSTHGRTGAARFLLGSTAERLSKSIEKPVWFTKK